MHRSLKICLVSSFVLFCSIELAHAELFGDYTGYTACEPCHSEYVEAWDKTPHAHAFSILKTQGEEKQEIPGCVVCHVVAMDDDGGFIDMDLTPELANVQCEACHGPGLAHVESQDSADIVSKPNEALCRSCHTEGQDKNFDYTKKSTLVHPVE